MGTEATRLGPDRFVRPRALFLGAACAFAACCLAGKHVSRQNLYPDFVWFHYPISPLSLHRPTASQLLAVAEERLAPDQIAVVVAGNSVLRAHSQGTDGVWTKHLQRLLGERYRVLNFALDGAAPADFGALAAEALGRRHPRVMCVTNTWAGTALGGDRGPDRGWQPYFFWDAYYKGFLVDHPEREDGLAERALSRDEAYGEARRHGRLDAWLRFDDLWTAASCRGVCTVWCPGVAGPFWKPRGSYADPIRALPRAERYLPGGEGQERDVAKGLRERHWGGVSPHDADPDWSRSPVVRQFTLGFPAPLRRRTLVVLNRLSPRFLRRLDAETLRRHDSDYPETIRALEQAGFAAMVLGEGYTELDYVDFCHFSVDAAAKMAADVAPRVRQMAEEFGYTE